MSKKLTVREVAKELYGSNYGPYLIYGAAIAIRGLAKTYGKTESEVIDDLEEEFTKITEAGEKFIKAEDFMPMEKFIELLNEYEPYIASDGEHRDNLWGYAYQGHSAVFPKEIAESYIISARYGFIKWLVENDKIDLDNEELVSLMSELGERRNPVKCLLMLLSIQDEPIRFLCEIIK